MRYTEDELRSLFQHKFDRKVWTGFLQNFMEGARLRAFPEEFHTPSDNEKGFFLGEYNTSDHYRIGLFQFDVKAASVARKRVGLRNLVKSLINPNWGEFDAAFAVFVSDSDWRLSFICDIKEEKTAPKRFTYVFGEESLLYRTPVSRLSAIQGNVTFAFLKDAFSVEKVSKDFFREYREIYADFVQYLTGNRYVKKTQGSGYELKSFPGEPQNKAFYEALGKDDKRARDFVKKMMGRITFLYFLQQKGWMCGDKNYMFHLFESSSDKDYYLKKVLVPLFFGVLNTKPEERKAVFAKRKWNDELRKGWETIPYLNGGLFEPDEEDMVVDACSTHIFRQKDFEELFEFYSHYNFTIDENDPSDAEVGVDPEMLGKIFESLLEDNKDKGAFYTPKEIVQYMCQESLVAYLVTKTGIEEGRLREFVKEPEENKEGLTEDERYKILDGVLSVKICDPAIGSGAFPIGLLNELVRCKEAIYGDKKGRADIKREIIRDNIYGVDIEKGAVDIARLRFWLSLVVDEDTPSPLPNLDYKIMQGNSLLEWYNGVDLSHLTEAKGSDLLLNTESSDELKKKLAKLLKRYFGESDHDKKFALKEAIKAAITEILDIAGVEISDGIDIAENSQFFLWHTWYNEVFANNSGFDICLGNPPYISAPAQVDNPILNAQRNALIKTKKYDSLYQKWDLYVPFMELGFRYLCKPGGVFTMIVPYPLSNQLYAQELRRMMIHEYDTFEIVDLNGTKIFENATVSNCIAFVRNQPSVKQETVISHIDENRTIYKSFVQPYSVLEQDDKKRLWNFSQEERNVVKHSEMKVLGDYCYISVGMVLNADEKNAKGAFKKEDLISEWKDLTHPRRYIEAKDIAKYVIKRERYLEYGTARCPNQLRRPTFPELYDRAKVIVNSLGEIHAYLDKDENYLHNHSLTCLVPWYELKGVQNKSISMAVSKFCTLSRPVMEKMSHDIDLAYLLGLVNSKYMMELLKLQRSGANNIYPEHLRQLPIPAASKEQQAPIISLVNDILAAKKANPSADTSIQEAEIDRLVYDLYDVPQEER